MDFNFETEYPDIPIEYTENLLRQCDESLVQYATTVYNIFDQYASRNSILMLKLACYVLDTEDYTAYVGDYIDEHDLNPNNLDYIAMLVVVDADAYDIMFVHHAHDDHIAFIDRVFAEHAYRP